MQFETLKTVADPGVFDWGWGRGGPSYDIHLCLQSSISRAKGDRCAQIEKHVIVSTFSAGGQLWRQLGR